MAVRDPFAGAMFRPVVSLGSSDWAQADLPPREKLGGRALYAHEATYKRPNKHRGSPKRLKGAPNGLVLLEKWALST